MFYPAEECIGYTDLLLGYGIVYSFLRFWGLNMFFAYKYTLIIIHIMGTISIFYLLKYILGLNYLWSLFGTIAFSYSNAYATHFGHTQLAAISALPLLLIFFIKFLQNINNRKKKNFYAYICIGWFVLITYNSWYIAYFTGLFGLIFLFVFIISLMIRKTNPLILLKKKYKEYIIDIIGYVFYALMLYVPFIKIYIPVLQNSSGYSYENVCRYMPRFIDIINVGPRNLLMGKVVVSLRLNVNTQP